MIVQLRVLDERFQLFISINSCFMHQATIGLGGQHLIKAAIHTIDVTLRNDAYVRGKTNDGRPKHLISRPMLEAVWTRLMRRLTHFSSDVAGFQLTPKYAAHFRHVFIEGKSTFTAGRIEMLFMVLPFVLRDIIDPEIAFIAEEIRNGRVDKNADGNYPEPPANPCPNMIKAFASFLDWYMQARLLLFPMDMAPELQRRAFAMKKTLQEVFPDKAGQIAKWNFPKMHMPEHVVAQILVFATILFTDTNRFEAGHKPNIKDLSVNSNGKDQLITITKIHDRASNLSALKQAASRHIKFQSRGEESESGSSSDDSHDAADDDILTDPVTSRPCEVAAKMPLWEMTNDVKALRREPFTLGPRGKGLQRIVLAACQAGAPARSLAKQSSAGKASASRFLYGPAEEYPALRHLPTQLGHFAYEYLRSSLGLPDLPEQARDTLGVLERCLVREGDGADIFTFGGVAIRSLHHKGTVRVRSRPFPRDKFFGRNPQVFNLIFIHIYVMALLWSRHRMLFSRFLADLNGQTRACRSTAQMSLTEINCGHAEWRSFSDAHSRGQGSMSLFIVSSRL